MKSIYNCSLSSLLLAGLKNTALSPKVLIGKEFFKFDKAFPTPSLQQTKKDTFLFFILISLKNLLNAGAKVLAQTGVPIIIWSYSDILIFLYKIWGWILKITWKTPKNIFKNPVFLRSKAVWI